MPTGVGESWTQLNDKDKERTAPLIFQGSSWRMFWLALRFAPGARADITEHDFNPVVSCWGLTSAAQSQLTGVGVVGVVGVVGG